MKLLCLQKNGCKIDILARAIASQSDILSRVIVSRSEIDLVQIKTEFRYMYGKTLEAMIEVSVCFMTKMVVNNNCARGKNFGSTINLTDRPTFVW